MYDMPSGEITKRAHPAHLHKNRGVWVCAKCASGFKHNIQSGLPCWAALVTRVISSTVL
jgi:hypothetical protein